MSLRKIDIEGEETNLGTSNIPESGSSSGRSKKSKSQKQAAQPTLSFEEAMDEMEALIQKMQQETLPLESMIEAYERGNRLLKVCRERLSQAQLRVERILSGYEPEETGQMETFDPTSPGETSDSSPQLSQSTSLKRKKVAQDSEPDPTNEDPQNHEFRLL